MNFLDLPEDMPEKNKAYLKRRDYDKIIQRKFMDVIRSLDSDLRGYLSIKFEQALVLAEKEFNDLNSIFIDPVKHAKSRKKEIIKSKK